MLMESITAIVACAPLSKAMPVVQVLVDALCQDWICLSRLDMNSVLTRVATESITARDPPSKVVQILVEALESSGRRLLTFYWTFAAVLRETFGWRQTHGM